MNRVYSILVKGLQKDSLYYQRRVDPTVGYTGLESIGELLVEDTSDASYYNYQAEQLVQICLKSLLNDSLAAFDPLNTYDHTFDTIEPITIEGTLPTGLSIDYMEPDMRHSWVDYQFDVQIDPSGLATINGVPHTFTNKDNLTSAIPLAPGLSIKIKGAMPGYSFSFILSATRQPWRDVGTLYNILKTLKTTWLPKYKDYRHSLDINDWLAAFVLNYCEVLDGS